MRSVADIPPGDDANDELSGISPELVLVDPELARLVREREASLGMAPKPTPSRTPTFRLVVAPEGEPAIVPRPAPQHGEPSRAEEPEPSLPVVRGDPAPAAAPPRRSIPPPLAEPTRRSPAPPPPASARSVPPASGAVEPVMPHPVTRPAAPAPMRSRAARPRRRWRRVLGLLGGVAATSLAVLGALQLTDRPSETAHTVARPQALGTAPGPRPATPEPSTAATKARVPTAKQRPAATTAPKRKRATTPRARAAVRSKVAPLEPGAKATLAQPSKPRQTPRGSGKTSVAPTPPPSTAPAVRRFAWAPVEGAIGYHVELFRGAERVLARETKQPALELGRTWRDGRRTVTLTPGAYRWYVWAVTKRGRATQPVVQATLTV